MTTLAEAPRAGAHSSSPSVSHSDFDFSFGHELRDVVLRRNESPFAFFGGYGEICRKLGDKLAENIGTHFNAVAAPDVIERLKLTLPSEGPLAEFAATHGVTSGIFRALKCPTGAIFGILPAESIEAVLTKFRTLDEQANEMHRGVSVPERLLKVLNAEVTSKQNPEVLWPSEEYDWQRLMRLSPRKLEPNNCADFIALSALLALKERYPQVQAVSHRIIERSFKLTLGA